MKMNVVIELDWLGDDGNVDEFVKEEIASRVQSLVSKKVISEIETKSGMAINDITKNLIENAEKNISEKFTALFDLWIKEPIEVTGKWGEPSFSGTIFDLMKKRFDEYVKNGKTRIQGTYKDVPMYDFIIGNYVKDYVEKQVGDLSKDIDKKIKEAIDDNLKNKIGSKFAELVLTTSKKD